jgi:hypothetical protein
VLLNNLQGSKIKAFYPTLHATIPSFLTLQQHHHSLEYIMDTWNLFDDIDIKGIIPLIVIGAINEGHRANARNKGSKSGADYLRELLNCGNEKRIYNVLRMKPDTFKQLCRWMRINGHLKDSREALIEQQVAMFLWTINFNSSNYTTAERWGLTTEPISR